MLYSCTCFVRYTHFLSLFAYNSNCVIAGSMLLHIGYMVIPVKVIGYLTEPC